VGESQVARDTGRDNKEKNMSLDGHLLTTYEALKQLATRFAVGQVNLVILVGAPGLMKSESVKRACRGKALLHVKDKKSPVDLYRDLYEHRDALVILDDVDPLLGNDDGKVLLRSLTETTVTKSVSWGTRATILDSNGTPIPKSFTTKSRVFLIANDWRTGGIFSAIESRGHKFLFKPSWAEVYKEAATWFHNQEILDYVHTHLGQMSNPDVRLLLKAQEMRRLALPGHDWREVFDPCMQMDRVDQEIARLLAVEGMSQKERVAEFVKGGFGDRATFFRRLKKQRILTAQEIPERIVVQKKAVAPIQPAGKRTGGTGTMRLIMN
jgi:hypothetical protein